MVALPRLALAGALAASMTACSPGAAPSTTTTTPATTSSVGSSTSSIEATTTTLAATTSAPVEQTVQVLIQPFSELGSQWDELFLPYGDDEDELGTAPGGDGLMLGPEYGTMAADGRWWMLDLAKMRIARFQADGEYLDALPIPSDVLVDGLYFQYQMPQPMEDGAVTATGFQGENESTLLQIVDDDFTSTTFQPAASWVTTDGTFLYGGDFDGQLYRVEPENPSGTVSPVDYFTAWGGGSRYSALISEGDIVVELPDLGLTRTLQLRYSEDPEVRVFGGIEVETGADGTIFILIYGAPESEESLGVGGYLSISPQGVVGDVEPIRDPFSPADPGSPAHLGVGPGTTTPWLMMIDEDGVRIYTRGG